MQELLFIVDPVSKQLTPVNPVSFADIGVRERQDLEAWVTFHPAVLGEELLVITSEFDRFDRCDRRLDVLALDENGCLVVVELKLDLSHSVADQQAIRYAAFCSTMTIDQVVTAMAAFQKCSEDEARQRILGFLGADELPELNNQPRIILAAGSLDDEELTSTVLWLRSFGVDITCVEMKPYRLPNDGTLVLVPRVIIPLPNAIDYLVRVEQKQVVQVHKSKEASRVAKLWEAITSQFDVSDLGFTARLQPRAAYMQLPVGYPGIHYEWKPSKTERNLRVALHFEANDRAINERRLKSIIERRDEVANGVEFPFVTKSRRKGRWAAAEFHLPESLMPEKLASEAARVMRLLIERTWPIIEPVLKETETSQPSNGH
jgi:hypothetical protein